MRNLFLIIFSLTFGMFSGCSQVQLESQKAALKKQEAELQKHSIELEALKSELSESKQENIDLEAKSKSAVQLLDEANRRNEVLQRDLSEVRNRLNAAVRLLTTEPGSDVAAKLDAESNPTGEAKADPDARQAVVTEPDVATKSGDFAKQDDEMESQEKSDTKMEANASADVEATPTGSSRR